MRPNPPSARLSQLLSQLVEQTLSPESAAELDEILRNDAAARDYYRSYIAVHHELTERGQMGALHPAIQSMPRRRSAPIWIAAAAALVIAAPIAWLAMNKRSPETPAQPTVAINVPNVAITSVANGVRWNLPGTPSPGALIPAGTLKIFSGDLTLTFSSGPLLVLRGPAEIELRSGSECSLHRGQAAFRVRTQEAPFIVRTPRAAVVNTGAEFSINVAEDGLTDVRVVENQVVVSSVQESNRSREEAILTSGKALLISDKLSPSNKRSDAFLDLSEVPFPMASIAGEEYADAVHRSSPVAYWRFEQLGKDKSIKEENGGIPLLLGENAKLEGAEGDRFLAVDAKGSRGFAITREGLQGLDTAQGRSVECLLYSTDETYSTAIALEQPNPLLPPEAGAPKHHAPQVFVLERMRRSGENIGHVHPDYAIRNVFRSPAGYFGGKNIYSSESHLIYRWVHVVSTCSGSDLRLYIDGRLSDQLTTDLVFQNAVLRPIIGRLQPDSRDEQRQWVGGIDEVAFYNKVLTPEEIKAHADALKHQVGQP